MQYKVELDFLVKLKKARSPFFRIFVIMIAFFLAWAVWNAIHDHQKPDFDLFLNGEYVFESWALFLFLGGLYMYALIKQSSFSGWLFAITQSLFSFLFFLGLCRVLYLFFSDFSAKAPIDIVVSLVFILGFFIFTRFFWKKSKPLWQSLIPYKAWRIDYLLRIWSDSAEKRRRYGRGFLKERARKYTAKTLFFFVLLILSSIIQSTLLILFAVIQLVTGDFILILKKGELLGFLEMAQDPNELSYGQVAVILLLVFSSYASLILTGYLINRFKRSAKWDYHIPISRQITDSDVLYLRSFENEIKYVPERRRNISRLLSMSYPYSYSMEELISSRLKFIGNCFAMGSLDDIPHKGKKLPPLGVNRYYSEQWEEEIKNGIAKAKLIVLIMGKSDALKDEITWIKEGKHLDKTLFLFPLQDISFKGIKPFIKSVRQMKHFEKDLWHTFEKLVLGKEVKETLKLDPKNIVGVCFYKNDPLILVGTKNERHIESVLDIGGQFISHNSKTKEQLLSSL